MICSFYRNWKSQARVCILNLYLVSFLGSVTLIAQSFSLKEPDLKDAKVYQIEFDKNLSKSEQVGLVRLISNMEHDTGLKIIPDNFPRIAINLETRFYPAFNIRIELLQKLLKFLDLRGFKRDQISLVAYDLNPVLENILREDFYGYSVFTSKKKGYFHPDWFHRSALPPTFVDQGSLFSISPDLESGMEESRKSLLPACLFLNQVYWINLARAKDNHFLGIDGATTSVTLNASSNVGRFKKDTTMGPATVSEILAIPEFKNRTLFSLIDFSVMQISGGTNFNSEFLRSESLLLLSRNPFYLDYYAMKIIGRERACIGLKDRSPEKHLLFKFAEELGMGDAKNSALKRLNK
jgi:hypothetical protein